jgi:hypothetical protein
VKGGTGDSGANLNKIFSSDATTYPLGDQSLDVGSYTLPKDSVNGLEAQYNDYTITYSGALTVDKAKLYYTYDGTKVYGDDNGTGTNTYTLVGIDKDSTGTSVNGYLKSFDSDKLLHTGNVLGSTVVGVTGTNAYAMTGTKADTSANITDTATKAITKSTAGTYYQVMVDASGTVLGYKLATVNTDANGKNGATITLKGIDTDKVNNTSSLNKNYDFVWLNSDTATTTRKTTSEGVTTTTITAAKSTETITPAELKVTVTGKRTYGDTMSKTDYTTDAGSLTALKFNITGSKTTDAEGKEIANSGLKAGDHMVDIIDTDTTSKTPKIISIISSVEGDYSASATKINERTNAGTYGLIDGTDNNSTAYPSSRVDVTTNDGKTGTNVVPHYDLLKAGNYNYVIKNGAHQETITPEAITITTDANREYGDAPDANGVGTNTHVTSFTVTTPANIETWDQDKFDNNMNTWKTWLKDNSKVKDHVLADGYGTLGSTDTTKNTYKTSGAVVFDAKNDDHHDQETISATLGNNYAITYQDKLEITKAPLTITVTGKRQYGDSMVNNGDVNYIASTNGTVVVPKNLPNEKVYDVNLSGVKTATGDSADSLLNAQGIKDKLSTVDNTDGSATVVGRHTDVSTNFDSPYNKTMAAVFELNNTNSSTETNTVLSTTANNDYYVANDGNNSLLIVPRRITVDQTDTKKYGTGPEHTAYGPFTITGATTWDQSTLDSGIINTGNTSTRETPVGSYTGLVSVGFNSATATVGKNYAITNNIVLNVVPADFTYTSDHTSYWQYQHIPAQSGKVTNSYGEDVSDLVGTLSWPTPADGTVVGIFPVWGRGSNDNSGNYNVFQAAGNATALEVKNVPKTDQTNDALNENLEGAWRSFRRPILDIMYLKIKDNGFKSWDNGVFVTANPYVPAGDKTDYGIITFNGQALNN